MGMQVSYATFAANQLSGRPVVLPNVSVLSMGYNKYTNITFAGLPPTLQLLYLENNSLIGSMPALQDLPASVTFLDVSNNLLSGSLPTALPPNLAVLNASGNSLTGPLPSNWSFVKSLVELRLDNNNMFSGVLPASWSAWGKTSHNSLQLSVVNASLHGHIPQQWVQQFCLAIVESSLPQILFQTKVVYINVSAISRAVVTAPQLELPAQHASINVTVSDKFYSFNYASPGSICGIPKAARNVWLL